MRLRVEPTAVSSAADAVRDAGGRLAALELDSIGALVSAGMPGSTSVAVSQGTVEQLGHELAVLAGDLMTNAEQLRWAAAQYAATEQAVAQDVSAPP